jgi:hypothetical protein
MRPRERDAAVSYSQHDRSDEVTERQPPTTQNEPQDIAKKAKWSSTEVVLSIGCA